MGVEVGGTVAVERFGSVLRFFLFFFRFDNTIHRSWEWPRSF